mgnify:CR=1 FL=1
MTEPATDKQLNYIAVLLKKNSKDKFWLFNERGIDTENCDKFAASKAIGMLIAMLGINDIVRSDKDKAKDEAQALQDERDLCGFDSFGQQPPYICKDLTHDSPLHKLSTLTDLQQQKLGI